MKKLLLFLLLLPTISHAAVVFENNFDNVPTWNPVATEDACWQSTQVAGGAQSCTQTPWAPPWNGADTPWNDYRFLGSNCSGKQAPHIGSAADIDAVKSGANFTPYGGAGKSYVHLYENCNSGSGSWGSDGLLGVYFGKTTGYTELYVQMKVKFDPTWRWANGAQMKLMHIAHFDEDIYSGVLQAYDWFNYNLPDMVPGIYFYQPGFDPGFYLHSSHTDKTTDSPSPTHPNYPTPTGHTPVSDGNWHTLKYRVKLNSAAGVADGIKTLWLDGIQVVSYTNVPYTKGNNPTAAAYGFNRVVFGGNSNNYPGTSTETQWYAVDNFVVSTTDIADNYVPGGTPVVDGACGPVSGTSQSSLNSGSANLCATGTVASFAGTGPWTWGCNGSGGGTSTASNACTASLFSGGPGEGTNTIVNCSGSYTLR